MRKSEFRLKVFLTDNDINWFLNLREYKKNPKRLYRQLIEYNTNNNNTPTGRRRYAQLIAEFEVVMSPEKYPELWI